MKWPWQSAGGRVVILVYHRVFEAATDPQLLCVQPSRFAEHLTCLKTHGPVWSLSQLSKALAARQLPERAVVITFDDGYSDNLTFAKPLLQQFEMPATVFVATGYTDADREFWWDEVERLCQRAPDLLHYDHVLPRVRATLPQERDALLRDLQLAAHDPGTARPGYRAMRVDELRQLVEGGLIEIGAHGVTHAPLGILSVQQQAQEINASKESLEKWLGHRVTSFAYPFGGKRDVPRTASEAVRSGGFSIGCANFRKPVTAGADPFMVPRFIVRNWDGPEFAKRLEEFFRV